MVIITFIFNSTILLSRKAETDTGVFERMVRMVPATVQRCGGVAYYITSQVTQMMPSTLVPHFD